MEGPLKEVTPSSSQAIATRSADITYNLHTMNHLYYLFLNILLCLLPLGAQAQMSTASNQLSAQEVLRRSVAYHDPLEQWQTFADSFRMDSGNGVDTITIYLPGEYFESRSGGDRFVVSASSCAYDYLDQRTGQRRVSKGFIDDADSCAIAFRVRNYTTYLTGLPMKLMDMGTPLSDTVRRATFKGGEYLQLTVDYPKEDGVVETWRYYFDDKTYALRGYAFEKSAYPGHGEEIILNGEVLIGEMKLAQERIWSHAQNGEEIGREVNLGRLTP